ncbi:DUF1289 domain-containing protein [Paraferrimonas sedimenticola]|uniref:DUF1289 domain-containing protein n=1 Tax=Paraferrimonas sedimenticola TaxID=375674 RepID=A0AA37RXF5_9GAMM|nr:DUF1289 domain-containing protein [Paraferrimonas sedimenticola]GLP97219.1 DUF1289 domain-containing protein [Paraferrimonas sedimenticola]
MDQLEFFDIPSPCRGICKVNQRGYCIGCARSREERFNWLQFSDTQKRQVIRLCQSRFARARSLAATRPSNSADSIQSQMTLFGQWLGEDD